MSDPFRTVSCSTCSEPTPSSPPPLTWSPAVRQGHREWTCPGCARANIGKIEERLDPAWW